MKLFHAVAAVALLVVGMADAAKVPTPTRDKSTGQCATDKDCKAFPGTVCILVNSGDYTQGKCTPNYGKRPVCRGGQAGLCPQYQTTTVGYLNAQCVLVDETMKSPTDKDAIAPEPATTAARRFLMGAAENASSAANATSDDATDLSPVKPQVCPTNPAKSLSDPDCWFNAKHKDSTISVQYKCISYDMCLQQSAWSKDSPQEKDAYCHPKGCVSGDRELCNNQGTCQGNDPFNPMDPKGYSCRCYAGYTGRFCEKQTGSKECDVDCGLGGACIDRQCVCYAGWQGLDVRCSKCTSDDACENKNPCNLDTGKCQCKNGFNGPTCGGKLNTCAGVKCKGNGFLNAVGLSCSCVCPKCPAGTTCLPCGGPDKTDCTTCPGASSDAVSGGGGGGAGGGGDANTAVGTYSISFIALAVSTLLAMTM